jgi:hypothetical protein
VTHRQPGDIICLLKKYEGIHRQMDRHERIHRQQDDLISLLVFISFLNKENRMKIFSFYSTLCV